MWEVSSPPAEEVWRKGIGWVETSSCAETPLNEPWTPRVSLMSLELLWRNILRWDMQSWFPLLICRSHIRWLSTFPCMLSRRNSKVRATFNSSATSTYGVSLNACYLSAQLFIHHWLMCYFDFNFTTWLLQLMLAACTVQLSSQSHIGISTDLSGERILVRCCRIIASQELHLVSASSFAANM